jgi:FAD binding domain
LTDGQTLRVRYLVGADGAHSVVRKGLGLTFEGAAFEEQYMLGDVEVDWSAPEGYAVRAMHQTDGRTDDVLVCIPLPGRGRYRMSMLVPDELIAPPPPDGIAHGMEGDRKTELHHIQAVLDRLAPEPTTARNLRWSSVFRISHRIVAADGLLDSYDAERRPVGEEVVGRTVRSAREGIGSDSTDPSFVIRREAQLLISYADSPIVGPGGGGRTPDARGLTRQAVSDPMRLYTLLGRDHTTLLYAGHAAGADDVAGLEAAADALVQAAHGRMDVYLVAAPDADVAGSVLPLIRDTDHHFARNYDVSETSVFVIRPDSYLGIAERAVVDTDELVRQLKVTFR